MQKAAEASAAQPVKEATLLHRKVASIIEKMKENSERIHLWMSEASQPL